MRKQIDMETPEERIQRIGKELSKVLGELHGIHGKVKEQVRQYVGEFQLKGNETVGWLGEMYAHQFFGGEIMPDNYSYDIKLNDGEDNEERIEVKTRRVTTGTSWRRSGVIKLDDDEEQHPTHLVFVKLNNDYSLAAIYKFDFKKLQDSDRFMESKIRGNLRGYLIRLKEEEDEEQLEYTQ